MCIQSCGRRCVSRGLMTARDASNSHFWNIDFCPSTPRSLDSIPYTSPTPRLTVDPIPLALFGSERQAKRPTQPPGPRAPCPSEGHSAPEGVFEEDPTRDSPAKEDHSGDPVGVEEVVVSPMESIDPHLNGRMMGRLRRSGSRRSKSPMR